MTEQHPVCVIGAGAWGTALAWAVAQNKAPVRLWAMEPEVTEDINTTHENRIFLPDVSLPANLTATCDMAQAVEGCRVILFVAPTQFMRATLEKLALVIPRDAALVSANKGIENKTLALPHQIVEEMMPEEVANRFCCISGPSFAKELVKSQPTAATIASRHEAALHAAQEALSTPFFRLYAHEDVVGVELGGALKNVIAIAAGISDGIGFGHNTRAAIITRGLSEIARLGQAMGAEAKTFAGLSGVGDLVLTCAGDLSRNRMVGLRLGQGEKLEDITSGWKAVAEGIATTSSAYHLADRHRVDMPIVNQVYKTLYEGKDPNEAVTDLMGRELRPEF
ncbi:MAG: NAD(P)-dependent glycerol-3-phosphate dehydrogenase [Nitrospinota bacterium]|nr:NAD(P)-dependent glycerol-3-phosphate dehydrogenase [Nitrospinota bacterium]MDH5679802.1 NAD(P)-dependent glycerol-3-phosphate dehydrogenase [Nitrospinota bacterium]MDH5755306.1 NAD(P)-dependent glycerol-3-phosphate dehydrogenase [Nitrospinota bacterium]